LLERVLGVLAFACDALQRRFCLAQLPPQVPLGREDLCELGGALRNGCSGVVGVCVSEDGESFRCRGATFDLLAEGDQFVEGVPCLADGQFVDLWEGLGEVLGQLAGVDVFPDLRLSEPVEKPSTSSYWLGSSPKSARPTCSLNAAAFSKTWPSAPIASSRRPRESGPPASSRARSCPTRRWVAKCQAVAVRWDSDARIPMPQVNASGCPASSVRRNSTQM
jgi:hypothetical protein